MEPKKIWKTYSMFTFYNIRDDIHFLIGIDIHKFYPMTFADSSIPCPFKHRKLFSGILKINSGHTEEKYMHSTKIVHELVKSPQIVIEHLFAQNSNIYLLTKIFASVLQNSYISA